MAQPDFVPGPETEAAYREALSAFGTGVTVVTTMTGAGPVAMTANSFASVSLDPPLVLWCPAKSSKRHAVFAAAKHYVIHIIAEDQKEIATHFARTGDDFSGVDWHQGENDLPILSGCLARFDCLRRDVHDGGDHSIVVGQVERAWHRPGLGLLYKRGKYGGFLRED